MKDDQATSHDYDSESFLPHFERCEDYEDVNQLYEDTEILVYNLPASALIWMAYIIPAYCMSGLYLQGDETHAIYIYSGFMVLYLLANQMLLTALGYALKHRHVAAILAGLFLSSLTLVSGLPLHLLDVGVCCQWLGTVSPARWILPVLLQREYSPLALSSSASSLTCKNKHFGVQHQDIIVQGSCLPPNGTAALQYVHFLPDPRQPEYMAPVAVAVLWFLCYLVASGSFLVSRYQPVQPRNNPNKP
uniref:ABC-2 type transporter transmembrane domain-containing protein n=1 Tax=Timema bartmani TaxID=61472 RepID=A0A7R9EXZ6_9NEOP|nr:unnamed protein product [Timema bartmani]